MKNKRKAQKTSQQTTEKPVYHALGLFGSKGSIVCAVRKAIIMRKLGNQHTWQEIFAEGNEDNGGFLTCTL